jgi:hypothetical protein
MLVSMLYIPRGWMLKNFATPASLAGRRAEHARWASSLARLWSAVVSCGQASQW